VGPIESGKLSFQIVNVESLSLPIGDELDRIVFEDPIPGPENEESPDSHKTKGDDGRPSPVANSCTPEGPGLRGCGRDKRQTTENTRHERSCGEQC